MELIKTILDYDFYECIGIARGLLLDGRRDEWRRQCRGGGASTNNVKIRGGGELRQANSMLCNTQEVGRNVRRTWV